MISPSRLSPRPRLQVLTPVYNEEEVLPFYEQAVRRVLMSQDDYQFQVLFIDDGSTDRSWEIIRQICARDSHFEGIRLSRNYGAHIAESAGFARANADAVVTLACDLQDPPEVVLRFAEKWKAGAQIVWGERRSRQDTLWRVVTSRFFHGLLKRFAMPKGSKFVTGGFFLVDRRVVECVRRFEERNRIMFALVAWTGFDQAVVQYDRRQRVAGKSGWNLRRMLKTMYDAFVGFSYLPIRLMTLVGLMAFVLTFLLSLYLLYNKLANNPVPGWTGPILGISFFSSIQFLLMGVSGEYLHRIYQEVVRRPLYFISDEARFAVMEQLNLRKSGTDQKNRPAYQAVVTTDNSLEEEKHQ